MNRFLAGRVAVASAISVTLPPSAAAAADGLPDVAIATVPAIASGYVKNKLPPERLVDPSYAEEAAKKPGPFTIANKADTLTGCR